jgi:hypothetical protein
MGIRDNRIVLRLSLNHMEVMKYRKTGKVEKSLLFA